MKLKQVLYWIFVVYICVNTVYTSFPLIMTFACIPTTVPFYPPVISSLLTYRLIYMTYLHMLVDLIIITAVIRSRVKQNGSTRFFKFTLIVITVNFLSNLIWSFLGYIYSVV